MMLLGAQACDRADKANVAGETDSSLVGHTDADADTDTADFGIPLEDADGDGYTVAEGECDDGPRVAARKSPAMP
jgi:hypothetical protein